MTVKRVVASVAEDNRREQERLNKGIHKIDQRPNAAPPEEIGSRRRNGKQDGVDVYA